MPHPQLVLHLSAGLSVCPSVCPSLNVELKPSEHTVEDLSYGAAWATYLSYHLGGFTGHLVTTIPTIPAMRPNHGEMREETVLITQKALFKRALCPIEVKERGGGVKGE